MIPLANREKVIFKSIQYVRMENYKGIKFKVKFAERATLKYREIKELGAWAHDFYNLGIGPKNSGNLSVRTKNGFIITSAGTGFNLISEKDFVEVLELDWEKKEVVVKGMKKPSSETFLHAMIYDKRPEINAVFHVHDMQAIANFEKLGFCVTDKVREYGSFELVEAVKKILGNRNYVGIKDHGIIALGKTEENAGKLIVKMHDKASSSAK